MPRWAENHAPLTAYQRQKRTRIKRAKLVQVYGDALREISFIGDAAFARRIASRALAFDPLSPPKTNSEPA